VATRSGLLRWQDIASIHEQYPDEYGYIQTQLGFNPTLFIQLKALIKPLTHWLSRLQLVLGRRMNIQRQTPSIVLFRELFILEFLD